MRRPPQIHVRAVARLNPSEDPDKVRTCLTNIIRGSTAIVHGAVEVLEADGPGALSEVYVQVRSRRTMAALRRLLISNRAEASTWFYLNRQAAYVGRIVLAESEEESPLGPIKVTLESDDLDRLIDWLVPRAEASRR